MRALVFVFVLLLSTAAQAKELVVACQRYESECTGEKCYAIAGGLKQDTKKEILKLQRMEKVRYEIGNATASATFSDATRGATLVNGKYMLAFTHVTQSAQDILLETKTDDGQTKERVAIDKADGFYVKYLLHTDGSIKDVPIGEPYSAYFGWCTDETPSLPATNE